MKNIIKKIFSPRNLGAVIAILIVTAATAAAAIPAYKSWLIQGTNLYTIGTNVGIGTANPLGNLHILKPLPYVVVQDSSGIGSAATGILSFRDSANGGFLQLDFQGGTGRLINWINGSDIQFFTTIPSGTQTRMTLKSDGNLGIGTTTPTEKLQVVGTIHSTTGGFKFPDGSIQNTATNAGLNFVSVSVYPNANAPTVFTDLDLSSVVGARKTLVLLKVINNGVAASIAFRSNGDTTIPVPAIGDAAANVVYTNNRAGYAWVPTDNNGIVEWASSNVVSVAIFLEAYLVSN